MKFNQELAIVAEHGYNVYCQAAGGKAYNGDRLPTWQKIGKSRQYCHIAEVAVAQIIEELCTYDGIQSGTRELGSTTLKVGYVVENTLYYSREFNAKGAPVHVTKIVREAVRYEDGKGRLIIGTPAEAAALYKLGITPTVAKAFIERRCYIGKDKQGAWWGFFGKTMKRFAVGDSYTNKKGVVHQIKNSGHGAREAAAYATALMDNADTTKVLG